MAQEIKNTFLKSKMNKDLDDRILPNGEYRDARNISVGRSEDNDVGALENIIGNNLVTGTDIGNGLTIIGIEADNSADRLFVFLTDYTDPNPLNPTSATSTSKHYIYSYNNSNGNYTLLVEGSFLNFSTTNRITSINLLENLLFWTDNRNQPRKININLATTAGISTSAGGPTYYTQEHQISVAKYNPYKPIELYNRIDLVALNPTTNSFEVSGNRLAELTPFIGATVISLENNIEGLSYIKVSNVALNLTSTETIVTVSPVFPGGVPTANTYISLIKSTMSNKNDDTDWPGDPDFLEDKFVRFSYRFKFDDNEYSLMAPFTQIAYIPKQNGYFINGDEDSAYQSTIVDFMENQIQNIGLVIPLPSSGTRLNPDYKISELEILFRESDGVAVKVLESISSGQISASVGAGNYYNYDYQSRKPYRTLPEAQTVRVYDKVPVRAFSQESSGNRIIYGNYRDQHTPPSNLNYNCRIAKKSGNGAYNNWVEYPNHSVKRNRNYQIGFVLADKFGRQSPVILSSVDLGATDNGEFYSGSTIYSPYDLLPSDTNVKNWFGDVIQVLVNEPIASDINTSTGTPGLYAIKQQAASSGEGFAITTGFVAVSPITDTTFAFTLDNTTYPNNINIPQVGDSLRGAYEDFVVVTNVTNSAGSTYVVTTTGRVSDIYLRADNLPANVPDLKFAYTINDLGWYSYKIVVKQSEQEYYNVYLPGILNGYPGLSGLIDPDSAIHSVPGGVDDGLFPTNEVNLTAHAVLFNDNINKVPRDLVEVGDQDKQYRSSVTLYGRVTNIMTSVSADPTNEQYYPRLDYKGINALSHTSTAIAPAKDFNMGFSDLTTNVAQAPYGGSVPSSTQPLNGNKVFYQIDTNPLIARISTTEKGIGATANTPAPTLPDPPAMLPFLAVYETAPFESNLDIYWETTSAGLIVDLNAAVLEEYESISGLENFSWDFDESFVFDQNVTDWFGLIDATGQSYLLGADVEIVSVTDGAGNDAQNLFEIEEGADPGPNANKFRILYKGNGIVFEEGSKTLNVYEFDLKITTDTGFISTITVGGEEAGVGALKNVTPSFNTIAPVTVNENDRVIISAATWEAADPQNGSSIDSGGVRNPQLVYRFKAAPGSSYPDNWVMDPTNGELTQATPANPVGATSRNFQGNPPGIYNIILELIDANAEEPVGTVSPAFNSIVETQALDVRITYPQVNSGAIDNTCIITPAEITSSTAAINNYDKGSNPDEPDEPEVWNYKTRIYYIANNPPPNTTVDLNYFIENGVVGTQPSEHTTDIFRIGTEAHEEGTIVLTANVYGPTISTVIPMEGRLHSASYFYRIAPDLTDANADFNPAWLPITPSLDYNSTGGNSNNINSPDEDLPDPGNNPIQWLGPDKLWLQSVRAFDHNAFNATRGIEYVVVLNGAYSVSGVAGGQPNATPWSWVHADDLHYPTCVPWQGTNLVALNGAGNLFKHYRSAESNSRTSSIVVPTTDEVWSDTPYGEYINEFYTTSAGNVSYSPADTAIPYINFTLDLTNITPNPEKWTSFTTSAGLDLKWVAGFDSSGQKIFTSPFVGAIQTTAGIDSEGLGQSKGTLRVYRKT